jgi:hypothetical protein
MPLCIHHVVGQLLVKLSSASKVHETRCVNEEPAQQDL